MAQARSKHAWGQTASLMALIANANRDPKKKPSPFEPSDFNPHADPKPKLILPRVGVDVLKQVFVKE